MTSLTDSRIVDRAVRRGCRAGTDGGSCSRNVGSSALTSSTTCDRVRARLLLDGEVDDALAPVPARRLVVLDAVVDVRDLVEPHRVAVAVRDDHRPVLRGAHQLAVGLHDERLVACRTACRSAGSTLAFWIAVATSSMPIRCAASLRGSTSMRTAYFCDAEHVHLRDAAHHRDALRHRRLGVLVDRRQRQRVGVDARGTAPAGRPGSPSGTTAATASAAAAGAPPWRSSTARPGPPRRCCGSGRTAA